MLGIKGRNKIVEIEFGSFGDSFFFFIGTFEIRSDIDGSWNCNLFFFCILFVFFVRIITWMKLAQALPFDRLYFYMCVSFVMENRASDEPEVGEVKFTFERHR